MVPILILDSVLLIKGAANPDDVPSIFGSKPLVIMSDSMELCSDEEAADKQIIAQEKLNDSSFVWQNTDPIKKHDLIYVKNSDIHEYLKGKTEADITEVNKELVGKTIAFKEYNRQGEWAVVVHRIAKVERVDEIDKSLGYDTESGWKVHTYGIHNPSVDASPIDPALIIGEWHGSRIGGIGSFVNFLSKWYGIVIFVGVPLVTIIVFDVVTAKNAAKKEADAKNLALQEEVARLKALTEALEEEKKKKEENQE